VELGD